MYDDWVDYIENIDITNAVAASTIVVGTIIAGLLVPEVTIPALIGTGLISFGTLLPVLWPNQNADNNFIWEDLMTRTEKLVHELISTHVKEEALAHLEGLKEVLEEYQEALDSWIALKKQQYETGKTPLELRQVASLVKSRFDNAHLQFTFAMPSFREPTYQVLLLPVYTQAANLHLILLQQGSINADHWNEDAFPSSDRAIAGTSEGYHKKLTELTTEYTNYCKNTTKKGSSMTINFVEQVKYYSDTLINVLDIVSLFPYYNKFNYPSGVKVELTRPIYTILNEKTFLSLDPKNYNEYFEPSLLPWLYSINLFTDSYENHKIFSGNSTNKHFTNNDHLRTEVTGNSTPNSSSQQYKLNEPVYSLTTWTYKDFPALNGIKFSGEHNSKHFTAEDVSADRLREEKIKIGIDDDDAYKLNHHLSNMVTLFDRETRDFCYLFTWRHYGISRHNIILNGVYTQFSFDKSSYIGPKTKVLGDHLDYAGRLVSLKDILEMICYVHNDQTYKIRIRYALNTKSYNKKEVLSFTIQGEDHEFVDIDDTFSGSIPTRYEDFKYKELNIKIPLKKDEKIEISVSTTSPNDSNIYLDKIEFIPTSL